ncbi:Zinc finger, GRF-type [Sesbania bispinosa]|nr:Zinc finger, GRF-type [Sesbania bispinosa]
MKGANSFSGKRQTASRSSSSSSHPVRACRCGEQLLMLTSKTSNNLGRAFWRCRNWVDRKNSCNYFRWADEEILEKDAEEEFCYVTDQVAEKYKRKMEKIQKKLASEKGKGRFLVGVLFISWVVTVGVILGVVVTCNCKR